TEIYHVPPAPTTKQASYDAPPVTRLSLLPTPTSNEASNGIENPRAHQTNLECKLPSHLHSPSFPMHDKNGGS
ncbi:hypothetical protein SARC_16526, partial [Sphaeroforma arctica JP610]